MNEWTFEIDWLPLTPANRWHTGHWSKKTELVSAWRAAAIQAARIAKLPKGLAAFTVTVQARHQTMRLTDFDAMAPTAKAVIDGLVSGPRGDGYGLAPDDTPEYARSLTLLPSFCDRDKREALIVTIREVQ